MMQLISVNLGQKRNLQNGSRVETTGIFKFPIKASVQVTKLGLRDDVICDTKNHGGPDQAVYVYGGTDYAWWSKELGRELSPGTFGENLTISDLECSGFRIGDRLYLGTVILEVSAPRIPCSTLAARMGDPKFIQQYRQAERPGLYCRVIQPGSLRVGDAVKIEPTRDESVGLIEVFRSHYEKDLSEESIWRQLKAPISSRTRTSLEKELRKFLEQK
jgi:MOSC domain-containing protein YiiM